MTLSIGERVYPLTLPQGVTLPALTYRLVSDVTAPEHQLAQGHPLYDGHRYQESRIQFDAYGDTFDDAEALSNELMTAITGYRGPWGNVQVESVLPDLSLDDYEPETNRWRRISDYFISWIGGEDALGPGIFAFLSGGS